MFCFLFLPLYFVVQEFALTVYFSRFLFVCLFVLWQLKFKWALYLSEGSAFQTYLVQLYFWSWITLSKMYTPEECNGGRDSIYYCVLGILLHLFCAFFYSTSHLTSQTEPLMTKQNISQSKLHYKSCQLSEYQFMKLTLWCFKNSVPIFLVFSSQSCPDFHM